MSASKKEIMTDLNFCKELMDRLYLFADKNYGEQYALKNSVLQNDIIRLRRELMNVSRKLAYDYGYFKERV